MKPLIFKTTLLLGAFFITFFATANDNAEKLLKGKWKMIKTEINGSEVKEPDHDQLVLELKKKGEFIITARFEETHTGTWKLSDDKKKLILNDQTSNQEIIMMIMDLDDSHLALQNFDNDPNKTLYFIPLSKKKAMHLNHKEYLLAKTWTVDKSDKKETIGTRFVFNVNKTFVIIPLHTNTPIASGEWEMSDDKKTIIMEMKEEGEELKLDIETLHRHELVLKNNQNGFVKHFVDHKLEAKELEEALKDAEGAAEDAAEEVEDAVEEATE